MKSIGIRTLLLTLLLTTFAHAGEWYDMQMGKMDNLSHLPVSEQIEILGSIVTIGRRGTLSEEHKAVLKRSQSMLIAIPEHAEHYERKIKDAMAMIENQPDDGMPRWTLNTPRVEIFQILGQIPSPETVRVLGDFLADERGGLEWKKGDPIPTYDQLMAQQVKNSDQAAMAFYELIDNPLTPYRGHFIENVDVPEWRLWYNQVKAGTRPIRFKGDPKEYNLKGLIKDGEIKELSRPERRTVDEKAGASQSKKESTPQRGGIIAAVVALLLVCGWWVYRRRQKA